MEAGRHLGGVAVREALALDNLCTMDVHKLFAIKPGTKVRLLNFDPGDTGEFSDKNAAVAATVENVKKLAEVQLKLFAENKRALLIILQGIDTSGKDGTIRHCMSGLNPAGVTVTSFKKPTEHELDHDFLWRVHQCVPGKGEIGVFNRSHYEDVLIGKVRKLAPAAEIEARYDHINNFEQLLADSGTIVLKFFLYISKDEQKKRLQQRLEDPTKNWKFQPGDLEERKLWPDYIKAYEAALSRCSTKSAPWFVIPSDKKWFRNLAVSQAIVDTVKAMKISMPKSMLDLSAVKVV